MMDYEAFKEYVKENILKELPEEFSSYEVEIRPTLKNNGLELDGLCIHGDDSISPVIYLNGAYERYLDGDSINDILEGLSASYISAFGTDLTRDNVLEMVSSFDNAKEHIISKIINAKENSDILNERPYTKFEDLAITYHILVSVDEEGTSTIPITNDLAATYEVTAEDLDVIAKENMAKTNPMVIQSMSATIKEMLVPDMLERGMSMEDVETLLDDIEDEIPAFVLSNETKINGAIWMTSPEALEALSEKLGGDFLILPSSIHEVIAIPSESDDFEYFQDMVKDVNQGHVRREERLSNNVYSYNAKEHKLTLATEDKSLEKTQEAAKEQKPGKTR